MLLVRLGGDTSTTSRYVAATPHLRASRAAESAADADELLVDKLVDPIATELGDVSSGATGHTMAGYESSS